MKLVDTLNLIENCSTLEELQAVMQKAISHYGFSSFAFLGMWPAASRQPVVLTNNSPDWDSTYRKENFYAHDPVLSAAKTSNSAFTWSHLVPKALNKKQSFVMRTAHDFGYREGVIVPLPLFRRDWPALQQLLYTVLEKQDRRIQGHVQRGQDRYSCCRSLLGAKGSRYCCGRILCRGKARAERAGQDFFNAAGKKTL